MRIAFDNGAEPIKDCQVWQWAEGVIKNNCDVRISQAELFLIIRAQAIRMAVDPQTLQFIYNDKQVTVNEYAATIGDLPTSPYLIAAEEIIRFAMKKRKEEQGKQRRGDASV